MDKFTVAASIHALQRRGEPVSLEGIHRLTGGSFQDISYWLREFTTPAQEMFSDLRHIQITLTTLLHQLRIIDVHTLLRAGLSIETVHALRMTLHQVCSDSERFSGLIDQIEKELYALSALTYSAEGSSSPKGKFSPAEKKTRGIIS